MNRIFESVKRCSDGLVNVSHLGGTLGMVLGAELGGVGNASLNEVGVLGGVFSFWPTVLST